MTLLSAEELERRRMMQVLLQHGITTSVQVGRVLEQEGEERFWLQESELQLSG